MYLGVVVVFALILVPLAPVIWLAWWTLADLGEKASGSMTKGHASWDTRASHTT